MGHIPLELTADRYDGLQTLGKRPLRVILMVEERWIAGAARAMLEFAATAMQHVFPDLPSIRLSVVTFVREPMRLEGNPVADAFVRVGVPVEVIRETGRSPRGAIGELRRVVAQHDPDIILSNSVKSHFLVSAANLARGCTWVAYHHGYTKTSAKTRIYNELDRWSLPRAARVLTVCEAFATHLSRTRGVVRDRISVVPVPVHRFTLAGPDQCVLLRQRMNIPMGDLVVLSVGRLSAEKGHADLLRSLAIVRRKRPSLAFCCVLVGDGPERSRLLKLSQELGLKSVIRFAGYHNDVIPFYSIADAFVLPSHSEGCPIALLEAMAAGLPAVATAVGGVPEFVTHNEDALLVRSRDSQAMADTIVTVLESDSLRKQLSSRAPDVALRHDVVDYTRRLISCFEQVLQRESPSVGAKS